MTDAEAQDVLQAGRAGLAELELSPPDVVAWAQSCGASARPRQPGDALLACALLTPRTQAKALAVALERLRPEFGVVLGKMSIAAAHHEGLLRRSLEHLLVEEGHARRKLLSYAGEGALAHFVATTAARLFAMEQRSEASRQAREQAFGPAVAPGPASAERQLARKQQAQLFERAFTAALDTLSTKDRALLRLNLVEGVTQEKLAQAHGVSRNTMMRWLLDARAALAAATRAGLAQDVTDDSAVDPLLRSLASDVDVSLDRLLREADGPPAEGEPSP